jgi:hypothetical protein
MARTRLLSLSVNALLFNYNSCLNVRGMLPQCSKNIYRGWGVFHVKHKAGCSYGIVCVDSSVR